MSNLPESSNFDAGVYQLELTDPVIGGPSGISNTPLKNLANRTKYLKDHVDAIEEAYAPKASPVFTGNPTAPTAAQFDNDTSLATTAFVQRALGNKNIIAYGASTTIAASLAGYEVWPSANNVTFTLPLASAVPAGSLIHVYGNAAANLVVQRQGADQILLGNNFANSVPVGSLDRAIFMSLGSSWYLLDGETHMKYSSGFQSSLGSAGYQKLPSGLIIQWGDNPANHLSYAISNFPIAFPNACRQIVAMQNDSGANTNISGAPISASQFGLANNAGAQTYARWIAIGY